MCNYNSELVVVIPVYNEEISILKVFSEWYKEVSLWTENFHFLIINDGSTDATQIALGMLTEKPALKLTIKNQSNMGHGQTCLKGYAWALEQNAYYVLQIDSDGQCDPKFFAQFWANRADYDVIYGKRTKRDDGIFRVFVSWAVKLSLFFVCGVWCVDANVPYRLIQTRALRQALFKIPPHFHLANVALAVLLKRDGSIRHGSVKIHFRKRYGGTPNVSFANFFYRGVQLIRQLRAI